MKCITPRTSTLFVQLKSGMSKKSTQQVSGRKGGGVGKALEAPCALFYQQALAIEAIVSEKGIFCNCRRGESHTEGA